MKLKEIQNISGWGMRDMLQFINYKITIERQTKKLGDLQYF